VDAVCFTGTLIDRVARTLSELYLENLLPTLHLIRHPGVKREVELWEPRQIGVLLVDNKTFNFRKFVE